MFIRLVQTPGGYARHCSDSVTLVDWKDALKLQHGQRREIYISKTVTPTVSESLTMRLLRGFYVEIHNQTRNKCELVRKYPDNLWNKKRECFMISLNEEFTGLLELSISSDFDTIEKNTEGAKSHKNFLHWPRVLILLDTDATETLAVGQDKPQPWAAIVPNREGNEIADRPLECSFDIVSAVYSLYGYNPWWTGTAKEILVVPSASPAWNGVDYGNEIKTYAVRLNVIVSISTDENNTPNACRLVINVDPG